MNELRVLRPALDPAARTIVISDIHGNLPYLRGLLEKLRLAEADQLILLGDMVEKGPESLATLRYIMGLKARCRLLPVLGNCDFWHLWLDGESARMDAWLRGYLLRRPALLGHALLLEMCREAGIDLPPDFDMGRVKGQLRERFAPEFDFLRGLPHILDTPSYTFVHGGLVPGAPLASADPWHCLKWDRFYDERPRFHKWHIVGHTPVCLYGKDKISAAPIIDGDCRLVSIDGGCVLKDDGQLNALIIQDGGFFVDWYDPFPRRRALDHQAEGERSCYIRWGDNAIALLERGQDGFCRVRHLPTGCTLWVPTDFLYEREGRLLVSDCTDYRPEVLPGDEVSLVRETARGHWIKKNGVTGWYTGGLSVVE